MRKNSNEVKYLIEAWKETQGMVEKIDERSIGSIGITVVVAILAMLFTSGNTNTSGETSSFNYDLVIIIFPSAITVMLSVYAYNYRLCEICKGILAGIETILTNKFNTKMFIHYGYHKKLYHFPYFITNDIMGIMFLILVIVANVFFFYQMYFIIEIYYWIPYLVLLCLFSLIYIFELATNMKYREKVKKDFCDEYNKRNSIVKVQKIKK